MRLRPSLFLLKTDGNNYYYPSAASYKKGQPMDKIYGDCIF